MKISVSSKETKKVEYCLSLRVNHNRRTFIVEAKVTHTAGEVPDFGGFIVYLLKKDRSTGNKEQTAWYKDDIPTTFSLAAALCDNCLDRIRVGAHAGELDWEPFLKIVNRLAREIQRKTGLDIATNPQIWTHRSR